MKQPRAWQRMLSGRRLDLLDPSPVDIEIEDIAHGLSRLARWNGQTSGQWAFSVAQHSLLVEAIAGSQGLGRKWQLAALLHDASEYVVGDLITPFKAAVGSDFKVLEGRLSAAVRLRFGMPADLPDSVEARIKRADRAAAFIEATALAGFDKSDASKIIGRPPTLKKDSLDPYLEPWPPATAKDRFLERFRQLDGNSAGKP